MDYNGLSKAELVEELKKLHTQLDNLRTAKSARADMPAALQESGETFRTVLDSVFDGVLLADAKTHDFFMANKTICDMLGYSQEEMRELHVENIHPEEDLPEVRGVFGRQLAGELKLAADIPVSRHQLRSRNDWRARVCSRRFQRYYGAKRSGRSPAGARSRESSCREDERTRPHEG
jgi:PAS domain-containing protein